MALPFEDEARRWLADDPDPDTRALLQEWLEHSHADALREAFGARLQFGTAGLRGLLGPGPGRMNRILVRQAAAGLGNYLLAQTLLAQTPDARKRGVVVGGDARRKTDLFVEDTIRVLAGLGIPVHFFPGPVPTPLLAWAVRDLNASAGVMVTASHNPPDYNGYKVYWSDGAQIIPPVDAGISKAIDAIEDVNALALPALELLESDGRALRLPDSMGERYLEAAAALRCHPELPLDLKVVYTPLHGVGGEWVEALLRKEGLSNFHKVVEQFAPDGHFPTVNFPNPEEDGALDLALALSEKVGADLLLANDPDADRLAVAERDGDRMVPLSGNELGVLLGDYLLSERQPRPKKPLVMTTIVSSRMLSRVAKARGAAYDETLTGFKWIATGAARLKASGHGFLMGYEEALGYTVGDLVGDKDGVSAALLTVEMAAHWRARKTSLRDRLDALAREYGLHLGHQHSLVRPGASGRAEIEGSMRHFRENPPQNLAGKKVLESTDFGEGVGDLPAANVLAYDLEGGARILLRPSGTEPKLKFYFEWVEAIDEKESVDAARARAESALKGLIEATLAHAGVSA